MTSHGSGHFIAAAATLAMLCLLLALRIAGPGHTGIEQRLAAGSPLRIGYALEAPYAFMGPDGELCGESVEVMDALLKAMQITAVEYVRLDFGGLIEELEAGRIDIIAGGMFITEARARRVRFTHPTAVVQPALLTRSGERAPGPFRLAVIEGSVEAADPAAFVSGPVQLLTLPDARTAMAALSLHQADGLALSAPSLRWMRDHWSAGDSFQVHVVDHPTKGFPAYALALDQREFAERLDRALAHFVGSPAHLARVERYGFLASDITPVMRGEQPQ